MTKPQSTFKKITKNTKFRFMVKLALVATLLFFLGKKGFLSLEHTGRAFSRLDVLMPAFGILVVTAVLGVLRWMLLLRAQQIQISWWRLLQLALVGNFFNIALPGAVSGDVVKAIYVAREVHGQRARGFSSILFDRVSGLMALVLVSVGALILADRSGVPFTIPLGLRYFILFAAASVVLFLFYLFVVGEKFDPVLMLFKKLEAKNKFFGHFTRTHEGILHYHNHKPTVLGVILLSALIHTLVIGAFYYFSIAVVQEPLSRVGLAIMVPLGLLVTAIPVMPAGVGTGHAAFVALFQLLGTQRGADVFNLFVLFRFVFDGGIGGLIYLRFKSVVSLADSEGQP